MRFRKVARYDQYGGKSCSLAEFHLTDGPEDCDTAEWSNWTSTDDSGESCSHNCGPGTQKRTRAVKVANSANGTPCPALKETRYCNIHPCPIDCIEGSWRDWSDCSVTCEGSGTQLRTRSMDTPAAFGGAACPQSYEIRDCNRAYVVCPRDCVMSEWTNDWTACSKTCGTGVTR